MLDLQHHRCRLLLFLYPNLEKSPQMRDPLLNEEEDGV
jgi:hypothetical protein